MNALLDYVGEKPLGYTEVTAPVSAGDYYKYAVTLNNVKTSNYEKQFTCVAYVRTTSEAEETVGAGEKLPAGNYAISPINENCVRSVKEVAKKALSSGDTFDAVATEIMQCYVGNYTHSSGVTLNATDNSVTLKGNSTTSANPGHVRLVEQSYVAWEGNYGVDTYIEFEFKGNNMPQLCFFANNINGQMCYSTPTSTEVINDGMILLNGIKSDNGTNDFNNKISSWGNHRYDVNGSKSTLLFIKTGTDTKGLSQSELAANPDKTYRMVIGTTLNAEKTRVFWVIRLFDKDTNVRIATLDWSTGNAPSHFVTGENTEPTGHIIAFAGLKGGEDTTFTVTKGPGARSEFDMVGETGAS